MNIYIDFDDCLCETARHFTALAEELFGKRIPYESMKYFDMKKSFDLTEEQYEHMMIEGHRPEALLSIEETPAAFKFFAHMPKLKVLVYDRPWNQSCEFPGERYHRCFSWDEIKNIVKSCGT